MQGFSHVAVGQITHEKRENTRVFRGEGTMFLKVPGLKSLESVCCISEGARTEVGEEIVHDIVKDLSMKTTELRMPGAVLHHLPDGTPVLARNICSNDGYWQAGFDFHVTGEWDKSVPEESLPAPEPKVIKKGTR